MKSNVSRLVTANRPAQEPYPAAALPDHRPQAQAQRAMQQAIDASPRMVAARTAALPTQLRAGAGHLAGHSPDEVRGQPTAQLQGVALNDEPALESEADKMGALAQAAAHRPALPRGGPGRPGAAPGGTGGAALAGARAGIR